MTHQVQDRNFHHTLVEVCGLILDHLDGDHLLRFQVLAFDDLPERSLTQDIQNEVPVSCDRSVYPAQVAMGEEQVDVLVTGIFTAQNVVDI